MVRWKWNEQVKTVISNKGGMFNASDDYSGLDSGSTV
jgi:hypothetical protein